MRSTAIALLSTIAFLLLSACGGRQVSVSPTDATAIVELNEGETIRVAVAIAQSIEGLDEIGQELLRAAEMAVTDFGPVAGFQVTVIPVETGCSSEASLDAVEEITGDRRYVGVIGHTCSDSCVAAARSYERANLTAISPLCGASILVDPVLHSDSFFRTAPGLTLEGEVAAEFAYMELGSRTALAVTDGSVEATEAAQAFVSSFAELGGKADLQEVMIPDTSSDQIILDVGSGADQPDVVYLPLLPKSTVQISRAILAESPTTHLIGGRFSWNKYTVDELGEQGEGFYAMGVSVLRDQDRTSLTYQDLFGTTPSPTFLTAYDATMLLLRGAADAFETAAVSSLLDLEAIGLSLRETVAYEGVSGILTCTERGECQSNRMSVGQVQNGTWVTVFAR